jgi:manganese-dependent inorganic pyrophosphatase
MIIVTGCDGPDLDGIACMIAYSELLNATGTKSVARYFGKLDLETVFVSQYTSYFPVGDSSYEKDAEFALVDTANPDIIDKNIPVDRVISVFDHRQLVFTNRFINVDLHIELVGSCATLITEEFQKANIHPSINSAIYLYSAIIFSTINFKNSVTTDRDIKAAEWLLSIAKLDESFIRELFSAKSQISSSNLYDILSQDFSIKTLSGHKIGIAQIEMVDINRFLSDLKPSLQETLSKLKANNDLEFIFFNGIDVIEGYSIFVGTDSASTDLFSSILEIPKFTYSYQHSSILMRKQIWPKVEDYLKNSASEIAS